MLLVRETRYFKGANPYASVNALWMRFETTEAAEAEQAQNKFIQNLAAMGYSDLEAAAHTESSLQDQSRSVSLLVAAVTQLLSRGILKGLHTRPAILKCPHYGNALAITHRNEIELRQAIELLLDLFNQASGDSIEAVMKFTRFLARKADKPMLAVVLEAAERHGIPWAWKEEVGYHQLGHGHHRKWVEATITSNLSVLGYDVARRKSLTSELLRSLALPTPQSILTKELDQAKSAASQIGFPVVVKPMIGHKGIGITVGVKNTRELTAAFEKARKLNNSVIVERLVQGGDVRLLVVGRKLVAAASRSPAQVIGNGKDSIAQLIEVENTRRARTPGIALPIEIDRDLKHTLGRQGLGVDSVPFENQIAKLRTVANWSQGGTATDVTDMVHPDNTDMAVRAALAVGIDVAGVDFITPDITRPYYEVGGAICEINYKPGLRVHLAADPERKRDIGSAIVNSMFDGQGRIDVILLIDANDAVAATEIAKRYAKAGKLAHIVDAYDDPMNWQIRIETALDDPDCDSVIVNAPASAIIESGTGVTYCRQVVQFGQFNEVQTNVKCILERICEPECLIQVGQAECPETVADHIANKLGLEAEPREQASPPSKITQSRKLWEVAESQGITVEERVRWNGKAQLQFGYGATQAIYRGARTGRTSFIATRIADDKQCTNALLRKHGLPHAIQISASSTTTALKAAHKIGYPVIVKPIDSSESHGVTGNIANDDEFVNAAKQAFRFSETLVVEPFLPGKDHRFLIIGGTAAHITRHETAHVTGNGTMTVSELVEKANENPLRGPEEREPYTLLTLEGDAMRMLIRQGLSARSVPAPGEIVLLSSICSLSTGGTAVDVTGIAHADNIAAAEKAARLVGLDICGVDFLLPDVSKSYRETGGAILEVNQRPSFDMHDASTNSTNRIRNTILKELLNGKADRQIPVLSCVLGNNDLAEAVAQSVLPRMQSALGLMGGVAAPESGFAMVGSAFIASAGSSSSICNSILADQRVEAALFLTGSGSSAEIPETAKVLDFRSPKYAHSADAITDEIMREFSGHAA